MVKKVGVELCTRLTLHDLHLCCVMGRVLALMASNTIWMQSQFRQTRMESTDMTTHFEKGHVCGGLFPERRLFCFLWVSADWQAAECNALSDVCMLASNIAIDI